MEIERRNIFLNDTTSTLEYTSRPQRGETTIPSRNPHRHALYLQKQFNDVYKQNQELSKQQIAAIKAKDGIYLEFSSKEDNDLLYKSLEDLRQGIRLLNVKTDKDTNVIKATVFLPHDKTRFYLERIDKYLKEPDEGKHRANEKLIDSIEGIKLALVNAFWTSDKNSLPDDIDVWCELWLRVTLENFNEIENQFISHCSELDIKYKDQKILFPERLVKLIKVNISKLKELLKCNEYIAEIRKASEPTSFFSRMNNIDQKQWIDDLVNRTSFELNDVSICILDTGVSNSHPLLENAFDTNSNHTVNPSWMTNDHQGHGTKMSGLALYNDLQAALESDDTQIINHKLESVKILPPHGRNPYNLYGAITHNAIYIIESIHPKNKRVFCMAVTSDEHQNKDGSPTSWSGEIDNIISGAMDEEKRLFLVSSGNVFYNSPSPIYYPDLNTITSVESPGQAWNALTIGAYSNKVNISEAMPPEYNAVADSGELCPYSSTSLTWSSKWPIKPEVLFDGGNIATDGTNFTPCDDLSLLTTNHQPLKKLFGVIDGTSSATAQAAWMASQLCVAYPDAWPETIRGLIVHSAQWTNKMIEQFCSDDKKSTGRARLLRCCGYGIPNFNSAIQCMENNVNLIVQGELQPFKTQKKMNEMHMHNIPWPSEVLEQLGEIPVTLKITLSYFVEPSPGEIGWSDKYRYQSCGLRFDIINQNENKDDFIKRINVKMRGEDRKDSGDGSSGSENWFLGANNRDVG